MIIHKLMLTLSVLIFVSITACGGGDGDGGGPATSTDNFATLSCTSTVNDSSFNGTNVVRIRSENKAPNTYEQISVRGGNATLDYMVHTNANPKALLILIAGGQLNAGITGTVGQQALTASGNYLVRSAHLFAAQGYKVITVNRASDWIDFRFPAGSTAGYAMDGYRTSPEHFNDLQAVINQENISPAMPVAIAGTSRGAISAVAQHTLAEYVLLFAPVTSGNNGSPVGSTGVQASDLGNKPVHLIWHESDGCIASKPTNADTLAGLIANVTAVEVSGGLNYPQLSGRATNKECDGSKTFHGFLAIESCVVADAMSWLNSEIQTP